MSRNRQLPHSARDFGARLKRRANASTYQGSARQCLATASTLAPLGISARGSNAAQTPQLTKGVLYQLSYIGENQPSAISLRPSAKNYPLLRFALSIRVHHIFATHPRLDRKHCKYGNRHQPHPLITDRGPRQNSQDDVSQQRHYQAIHWNRISKCWCTGEDSNLRTSQGGADLQSAGFNHSPTCAEMPVARLSTFPAAFARTATCARRVCACSKNPTGTERAHNSSCVQIHRNWKSFLMECRSKPAMPPRRANALRSGTDAGAGEGI